MKATLLKFAGALFGTPLVVTGKGLQATGSGLHIAGDHCTAAGVVVEASGHGTKEHFTGLSEVATAEAKNAELAKGKKKISDRLVEIDVLRQKGDADIAALNAEQAELTALRAQLEEVVVQMPAQAQETEVPAEAHAVPA